MTLRCPKCNGLVSTNSMHTQFMSEEERLWCICKSGTDPKQYLKALGEIKFGDRDYAENVKRNIEMMLGYYRSIPEKIEKEIRTLLEVAEERLKKE